MNPNNAMLQTLWAQDIEAHMVERGFVIGDDDKRLIRSLAGSVLSKWTEKAREAQDPASALRATYMANKTQALGLIVAIIEVVLAMGERRNVDAVLKGEGWS